MLALAAGMALLLGVAGIYGVTSYSVSQRTREIGIRIALGAQAHAVTRMFVAHGLTRSVDASLALERDAILELAGSEAARNLIRIFFLQERAKKLAGLPPGAPKALEKTAPVKHAAVIGAGVMGAGIAQWTSSREISVLLRDITDVTDTRQLG